MDRPEKNDLFYQLMQDSRLHMEDGRLEEDVLRQLRQKRPPIPAKRTIGMSIFFLSIPVILGLVICFTYATYSSTVLADHCYSLIMQAILIVTFLFLLEKIIQLLRTWKKHPTLD